MSKGPLPGQGSQRGPGADGQLARGTTPWRMGEAGNRRARVSLKEPQGGEIPIFLHPCPSGGHFGGLAFGGQGFHRASCAP